MKYHIIAQSKNNIGVGSVGGYVVDYNIATTYNKNIVGELMVAAIACGHIGVRCVEEPEEEMK